MDRLIQDLRYALRHLRRRPGFAAVVVVTLGLGIGANTAVFSVVDAVLLRPLPYPEADRLVRLWSAYPERGVEQGTASPLDLADWRAQSETVQAMGGWSSVQLSGLVLQRDGVPLELRTEYVTEGFFGALGAGARLGRTLSTEDHEDGRNRVVVLSHGAWQRHFGGDPGVVGRSVSLSGEPFTVAGVMPAEFGFPDGGVEAWAPLSLIPESGVPRLRFVRWLNVVGRLDPTASLEAAREEMGVVARRLASEYPEANEGLTRVTVRPLHDVLVGPVRPALLAVFGAVGLVLLVACANVASLTLARSEERARELAVRAALGAGRRTLARQLVTESVALGLMGGAVGLGLGIWGTRALLALAPEGIPRLAEVSLDLRILLFTGLVAVATGVLVGLLPARGAARADLRRVLAEAGRSRSAGGGGRERGLARAALVVGEIGLVTVLGVGAALLVRSYDRLLDVDPGFEPEGVLTVRLSARGDDYRDFLARGLERIREVPGVGSAALVRPLPLHDDTFQGEAFEFRIPGRSEPSPGSEPRGHMRFVSPEYFRTLGVPLLRGRDFREADDANAPPVVILSRTAAERYWGERSPVGDRIDVGDAAAEIVGVVDDVKQVTLAEDPEPAIYVPFRQTGRRGMTFVVRGANPGALVGPVQNVIWEIQADQPIQAVATMESLVSDSAARARFSMVLLTVFAGLALLLASVGVYGVVSYTVERRLREFGVRMALGAAAGNLLRLVLGRALRLAALGVGIGLAGAYLASRWLEALLFGVQRLDLPSFAATAAGLLLVAAAAALLPAFRATRADPALTLRQE